jgi:hypothetical protein
MGLLRAAHKTIIYPSDSSPFDPKFLRDASHLGFETPALQQHLIPRHPKADWIPAA